MGFGGSWFETSLSTIQTVLIGWKRK